MITRESPPAPLLRCLLVLTVVTTAVAAVLRLLADDLVRAAALDGQTLATGRFEEVLVPGAAVVLAACLAWFWLVTLVTCIEAGTALRIGFGPRSEEHTSELQSLMRISYAVFCLKKKTIKYAVLIINTKIRLN